DRRPPHRPDRRRPRPRRPRRRGEGPPPLHQPLRRRPVPRPAPAGPRGAGRHDDDHHRRSRRGPGHDGDHGDHPMSLLARPAGGVGAFVATLAAVRRVTDLQRYRYTFALIGIGSLLIPAVPGIGQEINGARLWVHLGPLNFQPGEAAKVTLVIFLAAYLVEK